METRTIWKRGRPEAWLPNAVSLWIERSATKNIVGNDGFDILLDARFGTGSALFSILQSREKHRSRRRCGTDYPMQGPVSEIRCRSKPLKSILLSYYSAR